MSTTPRYASRVRPHRFVKALGAAIAVVGLVVTILPTTSSEVPPVVAVLLGIGALLLAAVGIHLALTPVTVRVGVDTVTVTYWPVTRRIVAHEVQEALPSDRVDGVGHGYGYRWEGRGRRAIRLGGPMVTIVHTNGRLGVSVDDAERAATAIAEEMRSPT